MAGAFQVVPQPNLKGNPSNMKQMSSMYFLELLVRLYVTRLAKSTSKREIGALNLSFGFSEGRRLERGCLE